MLMPGSIDLGSGDGGTATAGHGHQPRGGRGGQRAASRPGGGSCELAPSPPRCPGPCSIPGSAAEPRLQQLLGRKEKQLSTTSPPCARTPCHQIPLPTHHRTPPTPPGPPLHLRDPPSPRCPGPSLLLPQLLAPFGRAPRSGGAGARCPRGAKRGGRRCETAADGRRRRPWHEGAAALPPPPPPPPPGGPSLPPNAAARSRPQTAQPQGPRVRPRPLRPEHPGSWQRPPRSRSLHRPRGGDGQTTVEGGQECNFRLGQPRDCWPRPAGTVPRGETEARGGGLLRGHAAAPHRELGGGTFFHGKKAAQGRERPRSGHGNICDCSWGARQAVHGPMARPPCPQLSPSFWPHRARTRCWQGFGAVGFEERGEARQARRCRSSSAALPGRGAAGWHGDVCVLAKS